MQRGVFEEGHPHDSVCDDRPGLAACADATDGERLIVTKLAAPQPCHALLDRPALTARLTDAVMCPLTLLSAPAGFGKTTALWAWLQQERRPHAWLSLHATDNEPRRLWRYLVAALREVCPVVNDAFAPGYASNACPDEAALTMLINALAASAEERILVLDNYHVIDHPLIHEAISMLVEYVPRQFHLVLASRADPPLPLARWRARHAG